LLLSSAGLYIKLGQNLASINHVLPPQYSQTFRVLYDEAPVVSKEAVDKLFIEETGKKPDEIFLEWTYEPVASASIAQVHKAKLPNGTDVAVKVQKPYVAKQIDWDLRTYRLLIFLMEKLFDLPLYWSVDTIESHLKTEVDFINEGKNAEQAMAHLRSSPVLSKYCYVPKVHWEHSTKRVLTCEWIDGVKFGKKEVLESAGFNVKSVMEKVVEVFSDVRKRLLDTPSHRFLVSKYLELDSFIVILILEIC
jgi:aarF domain-containing kinase